MDNNKKKKRKIAATFSRDAEMMAAMSLLADVLSRPIILYKLRIHSKIRVLLV